MANHPSRLPTAGIFLLVIGLPAPALAVDTIADLPGPAAGNETDLPTTTSPWGAISEERVWAAQVGWSRQSFWGITRLEDCTGDNCASEGALLSSITYAQLAGQQGLNRRVTVGGASQLQLSANAAIPSLVESVPDLGRPRIADMHAFGRITLVETPRTAVAVVPWVTLDGSLLGTDGAGHSLVGASTSLAGRMAWGLRSSEVTPTSLPVWTTVAEAGVRSTLGLDRPGPLGTRQRIKLEGRAGGSYMVTPATSVIGELRLQQTEVESVPYFGAEIRAGARRRVAEQLEASATLGWAPTRAPGDAHPRVVLGARWVPARAENSLASNGDAVALKVVDTNRWPLSAVISDAEHTILPSPPGLPGETRAVLSSSTSSVWVTAPGKASREVIDARSRPPRREVVLPDAGGDSILWIRVVDLDGLPMPRARIWLDGVNVGGVEADGTLRIDGLADSLAHIEIAAADFERRTLRVQVAPFDETSKPERIQLRPPIGQVVVTVEGPSGPLPKARVRIISPVSDPRSLTLDSRAVGTAVLLPGRNLLRVEHPGFGAQEVEVDVSPNRVRSESVRFQLLPAVEGGGMIELIVTDTDGRSVEAARISVEGDTIGQTASGGVFRIESVETGSLPVLVEADGFRSYETIDVMVEEKNSAEIIAPMSWEAGSVRIIASGPEGAVPDTVVRFDGPVAVDSQRAGSDGFLDMKLAVGSWTLTVDAPGHDAQRRTIDVRADSTQLEVVEVMLLLEDVEPDASLELKILDDAGVGVGAARVTANGHYLGTSSRTGLLIADGVAPGTVDLVVESPLHAVTSAELKLSADQTTQHSIVLGARPGIVRIHAESEGQPVDAFLRVLGAEVYPSVRLGPSGVREVPLLPGAWQLVLSHERFDIETLSVEVPKGGGPPLNLHWSPHPSDQGAIVSLARVPLTIQTLLSSNDSPIDSNVRLLGPVVMPSLTTGVTGEAIVEVRPGAWEVLASAPDTAIVGVTADIGTATVTDPLVIRLGTARVAVGSLDVVLQEVVEFETGSTQLLPLSWGLLDELASTLQANPGLVRLAIEGHTDDTGSDDANRRLSIERAKAVRAYLIAQGVSPSRLKSEGYGSGMPVEDNTTAAGRTANRRVAFRIVEQSEAPRAE